MSPARALLAAAVLAALFAVGCEEPPPNQPEGERCSMPHDEWDRCAPPLYCHPPGLMGNFIRSKAGPMGTCKRYLSEGAKCRHVDRECSPGLMCESQSGVCRDSLDISREKRGEDVVQ